MKSTFVVDLAPGQAVDELFALRKADLKEYPNGRMIVLELGDRSGRIKGLIWSGSPEIFKSLAIGQVYRAKGMVTTYKGESQITIEKLDLERDFDLDDFLPRGPFTHEQLDLRLAEAVSSVADDDYRRLVEMIFADQKFRHGFLHGVGGKLWHHNYIGGLAEHTLSVFDLCLGFASKYTELDRELLLAGALLHDIGKVESYSIDNLIDYTDPGRLIGHIVIGDEIVKETIARLRDFPAEKSLKIRHLVLSHQGSPEQSSPVPPMMAEGMALYVADLLDSKLAALRRIRQKEQRPGIRWSNYVNLLERHIYFGDDGETNGQEDI